MNKSIRELIQAAGDGKIVIPTIQRPFVWDPYRIVYFVDSLLRGWPFGTMLFLSKNGNEDSLFPYRRIGADFVESDQADAEYEEQSGYDFLVLDGQQRLQSLMIAFSGSYSALEGEWRSHGYRTSNADNAATSVKKYLCINLKTVEKAGNLSGCHLSDTDVDKYIDWKTEEELKGQPDIYARLVDVFHTESSCLQSSCGTTYELIARQIQDVCDLLVPILRIKSEALSSQDKEEEVVEIFTRLNTQGVPLTREQIMSAQIKQVWGDFPDKIRTLLNALAGFGMGGYLDDDDLVTGFNLVLQTATKSRKTKEAYQKVGTGNYGTLDGIWQEFSKLTIAVLGTLSDTDCYCVRFKQEYQSMHAIWFVVALLYVTEYKPEDDRIKNEDLVHEIIRWLMVSGWAKIWANDSSGAVTRYTGNLLNAGKDGRRDACEELRSWLSDEKLRDPAINNVRNLHASARGGVRKYYSALWVWMRMDPERAKLLTSFASSNLAWQVDHIIPAAWKKNDPMYFHTFNCLGNCWLLESAANEAKSDMPFNQFLREYDFSDDNSVARVIAAEDLVEYQDESKLNDEILQRIIDRGEGIQNALVEYIEGKCSSLNYGKADRERTYQPKAVDLYRGADFVASSAFLSLRTGKSRSSYLSNIRRVFKHLKWSPQFGPLRVGSEAEVKEHILQHLGELRKLESSLNSCRSAWRMYLNFLVGDGEEMANPTEMANGPREVNPAREVDMGITNFAGTLAGLWNEVGEGEVHLYDEIRTYIIACCPSYRGYLNHGVNDFSRKASEILNVPNFFSFPSDKNKAIDALAKRMELIQNTRESWNAYLQMRHNAPGAISNKIISIFSALLAVLSRP